MLNDKKRDKIVKITLFDPIFLYDKLWCVTIESWYLHPPKAQK